MVEECEKKQCGTCKGHVMRDWKCLEEKMQKMLFVVDAVLRSKSGRGTTQNKSRSYGKSTTLNTERK